MFKHSSNGISSSLSSHFTSFLSFRFYDVKLVIRMQTFCIALNIRLIFNFTYGDHCVALLDFTSLHFASFNFFIKFKMPFSFFFSQILNISHTVHSHTHSFKQYFITLQHLFLSNLSFCISTPLLLSFSHSLFQSISIVHDSCKVKWAICVSFSNSEYYYSEFFFLIVRFKKNQIK